MRTTNLRGLLGAWLLCAIAALLLAMPGAARAQAPAPDDELLGLWTAQRRFGPAARGPLVIQQEGGDYVVDFLGRRLPLREARDELVFELPDGQGAFRGRREGKAFVGHWFRAGTPVNQPGDGTRFVATDASPVRFVADGPRRWRGLVDPLEETFTFHLLVTRRADGSLAAVLRNPERDWGTQIGVQSLVRQGEVVTLRGRRGGQAEDRDLVRGSYDPQARVLTLATRGGTYDFRRAGDESGFWPRGRQPARYAYRAPLARDDGWPVGTLEAAAIDRQALERFVQSLLETPMASADAPQVHGLLIARHGKLVLEEYFHGEHRDKPHQTRSASKSAVAVLIGAAMRDGAPLSLDSPVYAVMNGGAFPAGLEPAKRAMTLEHLLTMSSGFWCDDTDENAPGNEETMDDQAEEPDFYRFTLRVPLATPPGENAVYCSASPNLALGMLDRASGERPLYAFDRLIGGPMQFGPYVWGLDDAGNLYGGGGVMFLPRDFLKFGQLMLDGGTWKGRRILDAGFVARASAPLYRLRNVTYGYQWWSEDYPYKNRTVRVARAAGAGGQLVNYIPELDLVVAVFGANYSSRVQGELHHFVPRFILPAVREPGDDPAAPVVPREFKSPYGASKDGSRL
jgi:CubicO group peptidase (beta-lactamase class C family)